MTTSTSHLAPPLLLACAVALAAGAGVSGFSQGYRVEPGNTLEDFSHQLFDDKDYWRGIRSANPEIKNPDLIYPGQTLRTPESSGQGALRKGWRPPPPADHSLLLRRMENELAAPYSDSSAFTFGRAGGAGAPAQPGLGAPAQPGLGARARPAVPRYEGASAEGAASLERPQLQYPQFWLMPMDARIIATMGPKDDSQLIQVNRDTIVLKRRGEITAKPFCLIRPLANDAATGRRLYRVIARYYPKAAPLDQPFALQWRHLEAQVGDQLSAKCPPSLRAIRSRYAGESRSLAIPREEVTVFHPEMRQFILPGQDALWRLASGALPDSIRYLRLYRTAGGDKIATAKVEILQRSDRNLIVRYLSLASPSF